MPEDAPVLEMEAVQVPAMDGRAAVRVENVSWTVREGEWWAVGGRHGAGKSDLLAAAAGLSRAGGGTIRLFGRDVTGLAAEEWLAERLRIGYVFGEGGRGFQHLTVAENVSLPLRYHHEMEDVDIMADVERLLNATGLTDFADEFPARLSRAMKQRIGLARALALRPDLLLLDDPLSGLDPVQCGWWIDFLGKLSAGHPLFRSKRVTLVLAAAGLRRWLEKATHFACLHDGGWRAVPRGELETTVDPVVRELMN